jgi:hypothetical protein
VHLITRVKGQIRQPEEVNESQLKFSMRIFDLCSTLNTIHLSSNLIKITYLLKNYRPSKLG